MTPDALVESGFFCRTSDAYAAFGAICASTRVDADIASVSLIRAKDASGVALVVQCETHEAAPPAAPAAEDAGSRSARKRPARE